MRIITVTCPHCGIPIAVSDNASIVQCEYCKQTFMVGHGKQVSYGPEDAEIAGYKFEIGRQRAIRELKEKEERKEAIAVIDLLLTRTWQRRKFFMENGKMTDDMRVLVGKAFDVFVNVIVGAQYTVSKEADFADTNAEAKAVDYVRCLLEDARKDVALLDVTELDKDIIVFIANIVLQIAEDIRCEYGIRLTNGRYFWKKDRRRIQFD